MRFTSMHKNSATIEWRFFQFCLLVLLLFSMACAPIFAPRDPPVRLQFFPDFSKAQLSATNTTSQQLVVAFPSAFSELNSDAILLLFSDKELRRLAGYRWSSTAPNLVQSSLVRGLEESRIFRSVSDERSGISSALRLITDLEQFYLRYPHGASEELKSPTPPTAIVQATFRMVDYSVGETIDTISVSVEVPATSTEVKDMVKACEEATIKMVEKLVPWISKGIRN